MKFFHLSDLHIGKRLNEYSLLDDQRYILDRIIGYTEDEQPDALIIAGDIYDKAVPSAEAVRLFDDFLHKASSACPHIFIIAGNHDSPERLAFAARTLHRAGIHISPVWEGTVLPLTLDDEHGKVDVFMLPYIKPVHALHYYPDAKITSYTDAVGAAIAAMPLDTSRRSVLITHQFVTGAKRCDSEELSVGGTDNVDASVFGGFDYIALGHLHGPQQIGRESLRYCGSPLKYSFSEANHKKSVTVVNLGAKGDVGISTLPLVPRRELRELRDEFARLINPEIRPTLPEDDYIRITLTDEDEILDAVSRLREFYPNIMRLDYDNSRTRAEMLPDTAADITGRSPFDLFSELFYNQNGREMSEAQREYTAAKIAEIWEGVQ